MRLQSIVRLFVTSCFLLTTLASVGQVTASVPYTVSTFATGVAGTYFQPDSIAVLGSYIYIG